MLRVGFLKEEEFHFIREEWNELLRESEANNITLTWEWLYTWWEVFRDRSRKLMVLTVRNQDMRLVGIAPLQLRTIKPYPFLPAIRRLEFLASGEDEADEICSDYLNFIILRGWEEKVIPFIFGHLTNDLTQEWDELVLDSILGISYNLRRFEAAVGSSSTIRYQEMSKGTCYYISLPGKWEEFLARMNGNLRRAYRYDLKRLSAKGRMIYKGVSNLDELDQGLKVLMRLHQDRWTEKEGTGVFTSEKFFLFHKKFAEIALKNGWLQLRFLLLDGNPLAALYNFKYNGKIYFYQSGIDTQSHKAISIGLILIGLCIQEGISEGMREFDFLRGNDAYKKRWTDTFRHLKTIWVSQESMKIKGVRAVNVSRDCIKKVISGVSSLFL